MKIENTLREDHQIQLVVEIEPEVLDNSKRKAARKIAERIRIPGFRPGKAPYNVVERQVGDAAILEDAIEVLLEDVYPKILDEAGVKPYGPGSLQNIPSMDPPTFEFVIPLEPEVTLGDYRAIRITTDSKQVSQEEVDRTLENLRERQASLEPVTRPIQESDLVHVTLSAERAGDADDQSKVLVPTRKYPVIIDAADSDVSEEWPFPGFSRNLIGMETGAETTISHTFPEDYETESLRGVDAIYSVKIDEVKARNLPALDDELAKAVSEHETLDALIAEIKTSLQERIDQQGESEYETQVLEKILEQATVKYPPQMLAHELEHMLEDFNQQLQQAGMDLEMYQKSSGGDLESLKKEMEPEAIQRITRGLALMEITRAENIQIPNDVLESRLNDTLQRIRQTFPEDEFRKIASGESLQSLANRIATDELTRLTLERIRKLAMGETIEDVPAESPAELVSETAETENEPETVVDEPENVAVEPETASDESENTANVEES